MRSKMDGAAAVHRFDGRIALVTGAGQGIGRAIALRLAAEGATVVVNDLRREPAADVADEVRAAGGQALVAAGDVSDPQDAEAVVALVVSEMRGLDVLVNNAGITRDAPLHRMSND